MLLIHELNFVPSGIRGVAGAVIHLPGSKLQVFRHDAEDPSYYNIYQTAHPTPALLNTWDRLDAAAAQCVLFLLDAPSKLLAYRKANGMHFLRLGRFWIAFGRVQ